MYISSFLPVMMDDAQNQLSYGEGCFITSFLPCPHAVAVLAFWDG